MKAVIFVGPSLPVNEARQVLDAVYLPPAVQSDLLSAVTTHQPDVIGLIDGEFNQSLSVWHKEILYALERGVRVYGASSMGALRAAETDVFGMVGVGEIYRQFASGELTDDDEVALEHSDAEHAFLPLSEPMVNIRATLRRAVAEGVLHEEWHDRLIALAKSRHFPDRNYPDLFRQASEAGIPRTTLDGLRAFVAASAVDLKRADAIALLEAVRDLPDPLPPAEIAFTMTRSHLFDAQFARDRTVRRRGVDVPLASIGDYAALHAPDFNDLNFASLNRALATVLASILDLQVTPNEVAIERWRFRLKHGLKADEALAAWLVENDLSEEEFSSLMDEMATCRRLHRWFMVRQHFERTTKVVLDELRLRNRYEHYADAAADQERILQEQYPDFRDSNPEDLPWEQLVLDHIRETECKMELPAPLWAEEAGFRDLGELMIELRRARLARRHTARLVTRLLSTFGPDIEHPAASPPANGHDAARAPEGAE